MTTIPALIEKLRGLKGPDRDVDAEIATAAAGYVYEKWKGDRKAWFYAPDGRRYQLYGYGYGSECLPRFTASLDAVTALIERDGTWDWSIFRDNGEAIAGVQPASDDGCDCADTHAPTPALALLIAFLEAKMEIEE
jgi:hypothetical protein